MKKARVVGFVGRGMVASVLYQRMVEQGDFRAMEDIGIDPRFFSSSMCGKKDMIPGYGEVEYWNSEDVLLLNDCDIIVTCQGSEWSKKMYPKLMKGKWKGIFLDASSAFRERDDCVIVLDPVNRNAIDASLKNGGKLFAGGNCTVSLMLMGLHGLFKEDLVEFVISDTMQAASGAGAAFMLELIKQMRFLSESCAAEMAKKNPSALEAERLFTAAMRSAELPQEQFGYPLAGNILAWIDKQMENGQSREEWKGILEGNKILGNWLHLIPIDGTNCRVSSLRCHSQILKIKLTKNVSLADIESILASANEWVRVIPNNSADTLSRLSPAAVTGKLDIPIGRIRMLNSMPRLLTAYTVGDQLLWGAAEPIVRTLQIILEHLTA